MRLLRPIALLLALSGASAAQEVELLDLGNGLMGNAYFSPYEDLDRKVLYVLDQAQPGSTVYMSYYSLSYHEYPKKYKELAGRGVRVRLNLFEGDLEGTGKQPTVDDMIGPGTSLEVAGKIDQPGDADWYSFEAEAGVEYELQVAGTGVSPAVRLIGVDGVSEVARAAAQEGRATLIRRAPATGKLFAAVSADTAQATGSYQLIVRAHSQRGTPKTVQLQGDPGKDAPGAAKLELARPATDVARIPNIRNPLAYASMHTKITVVNEEWIITGSANLSASASLANHEHVIILKSKALAREFMAEFEEQRRVSEAMHGAMTPEEWATYYGSQTFPGDWQTGRGTNLQSRIKTLDKLIQTSGFQGIDSGFSPEDKNDWRALKVLKTATSSIYISMYAFVNERIARTVVEKARQGVKVIVIADDHQQQIEQAAPINELMESEPKVRWLRVTNHLGNFSALHHKCAVVDEETVIGGSYNWTSNATYHNDENMTVIRSKVLARRFLIDFAALLAKYDPSGENIAVEVPGDTTRVLFSIAYGPTPPKGFDLVVVGDAPALGDGDPQKGLILRGSKSVEPNLLGSASLPRGKQVKWRVVLVKRGNFAGVIEGENAWSEQGAERVLETRADGVPMILQESWQGTKPTPQ